MYRDNNSNVEFEMIAKTSRIPTSARNTHMTSPKTKPFVRRRCVCAAFAYLTRHIFRARRQKMPCKIRMIVSCEHSAQNIINKPPVSTQTAASIKKYVHHQRDLCSATSLHADTRLVCCHVAKVRSHMQRALCIEEYDQHRGDLTTSIMLIIVSNKCVFIECAHQTEHWPRNSTVCYSGLGIPDAHSAQ